MWRRSIQKQAKGMALCVKEHRDALQKLLGGFYRPASEGMGFGLPQIIHLKVQVKHLPRLTRLLL